MSLVAQQEERQLAEIKCVAETAQPKKLVKAKNEGMTLLALTAAPVQEDMENH